MITYAQVINHDVDVTLVGDVEVHIHDAYIDSLGGAINNDGQLYFYQSLTNRTESPLINPNSTGKIIVNGEGDQYLKGEGFTFGNQEVEVAFVILLPDYVSCLRQNKVELASYIY